MKNPIRSGQENKAAGLEIVLKEALADFFIGNTSGNIWVADENLNLVYANKSFYDYFSLGQQNMRHNIVSKVPDEIMKAFYHDHFKILTGGQHVSRQVVLQTADGNEAIFQVWMFRVTGKMVAGYAIKLGNSIENKHLQEKNERLLLLAKEIKELEAQLAAERLLKQKEISENVIRVLERERTLIGHELHDNINQVLAVVRLYVGMLHPVAENEKMIKLKAARQLNYAINEIRNLSKELVMPKLQKKGLIASIKDLIAHIDISKTINIKFSYDRLIYPISSCKKITLFRIIQEQLRNILKHSKATDVTINLQLTGNEIQLVIHDNGVGFNPRKKIKGIGLSNIHERTEFYNGRVKIETAEGKGCKITVSIPVN